VSESCVIDDAAPLILAEQSPAPAHSRSQACLSSSLSRGSARRAAVGQQAERDDRGKRQSGTQRHRAHMGEIPRRQGKRDHADAGGAGEQQNGCAER
jgi:hypothetical protein